MKHIIVTPSFYIRRIIKGKRIGVKKWRWAIYIEENVKKEVNYLNYLNCRKYKNNLDNSNALVVY